MSDLKYIYLYSALLLILLLPGVSKAANRAASSNTVSATSTDLVPDARKVPLRGVLRLTGVELDGLQGARDLELERFQAFAPDARIFLDDSQVPVPDNRYFKGRIAGEADSRVLLTLRQSGELRGLVFQDGKLWVLAGGPGSGIVAPGLVSRRADPDLELADRTEGFRCLTDRLPIRESAFEPVVEGTQSVPVQQGAGPTYAARVAIDTDTEYFEKFGGAPAAIDYAADLIGYSSTIYESEVDTSLQISFIQIRSSSDPWHETDCDDMLYEVRDHWQNEPNLASEERTLVHMLSGKSDPCGIAWIGVLCNDTYGFGVSSGLNIGFNINDPSIGWDIMVVSHEIGHNFNSPHTHCYGGIGANGIPPVDQCSNDEASNPWYNCHSGAEQLPCSGQDGCGTLMSYCHTLPPGMSNIDLTFGRGHPYGFLPDRVPDRMQAHVASEAIGNPSCFNPLLTITKQGSSTGTVTSQDGGIDCGSDCTEVYTDNDVVTLTAIPGANAVFAGWSGHSDCSDGVVTMTSSRTCTATFNLVPRLLTIAKAGGGTVTSSPAGIDCGVDCQESYTHGTFVQLTATPASGSVFSGWSGNADCSDGDVTMDQEISCTATFSEGRTLTVTRSGSGTGGVTSNPAGINCGGDCQQTYNQGTVVTLTATPGANSVFAGWNGDADCADNTISMTSDKTCDAIFNLVQRSLSVSHTGTGSGTITSSPSGIDCGTDCEHSWSHGTAVQLTATPAPDSVFNTWSGNSDCGDGQLTLDANKSCAADFQAVYELTVYRSGGGSGVVTSSPPGIDCGDDCSESYQHGTGVSLIAAPDFGSELTGWSGDSDCTDGELDMTGPRSCTATFEPCSIQEEEDFSGKTVATTQEFVACNILTAGNFVIQAPDGDVTFRAGNSIILMDGFVVQSGGSFRAVIGPPD